MMIVLFKNKVKYFFYKINIVIFDNNLIKNRFNVFYKML